MAGCMSEGGIMEYRIADFSESGLIMLVRPKIAPCDIHHLQRNDRALHMKVLFSVYDGWLDNKLEHVGVLNVNAERTGYGREAVPIAFGACGGTLGFNKAPSAGKTRDSYYNLTCSRQKCGMRLQINQGENQIRNTLFFLMLKQMAPTLKTLNFIDCQKIDDSQNVKNVEGLRELGLIAVVRDYLYGTVRDGYCPSHTQRYDLGFTLTLGMQTQENHGGYDHWLNVLLGWYFHTLGEYSNHLLPFLIGPPVAK